jgi:hypothetical protein
MVLAMKFSASVRPAFVKAARPQQMRSGRRSMRVCAKVRAQQAREGAMAIAGIPQASAARPSSPSAGVCLLVEHNVVARESCRGARAAGPAR